MDLDWQRVRRVWRRSVVLATPLVGGHVLITAMQTVDVFIAASISSAAITAVGLADLFVGLTVMVGVSIGKSVLSVTSQERDTDQQLGDEAVSQGLILGAVFGIPFVVFGQFFGSEAVRLIGAPPGIAEVSGAYLRIVLLSAPAYHVGLIAGEAIKGTGETRLPMVVETTVNLTNIVASLLLGVGLLGVPQLGVPGIATATAVANVLYGFVYLWLLWSSMTEVGVSRPRNPTVGLQLVRIGVPRLGESLVTSVVRFPLNTILLGFGVNVNAGYHLARRVNRQVTSPLRRGLKSTSSIVTGSDIGAQERREVRANGVALVSLGVVSLAVVGVVVYLSAPLIAAFGAGSAAVEPYAVGFMRVYAIGGVPMIVYNLVGASLLGGGETRITFYARVTGSVVITLGGTYVVGVLFGYGVLGAYLAVLAAPIVMSLVVLRAFFSDDWLERAEGMITRRRESHGEN